MVAGEMECDKPPAVKPRKSRAQAPARPARSERSRGGEARGIADLIPAIGETSFRRFGFVQSSLVSRWSEIAGPRYATMASPESIAFPRGKKADGTLNLIVTSATAIFIQHAEPEIMARVNRFFGYQAVVRIKYRHGTLARPLRPEPHPAAAPPSLKPVAIAPGDGLKAIGDPELQTVLESLARSMAEKEAREAAPVRTDRAPLVQLKSDNLKPARMFAPPPSDKDHR